MLDTAKKNQVLAELEQLSDEDLEEVYAFLNQLMERRTKKKKWLRLEDLQELMFEGPEDMSERHDKYVLGNHYIAEGHE